MSCRERCSNYGLELILIFFGILMSIGFLVTYIIAVQENHVTAYLPYISDTGGRAPESCVFTFVCGLGTIFMLVFMCLRYKHLHHYYHGSVRKMHCLNLSSLCLGFLASLGLLIVGSFQNVNVPAVHFIGAFMAFGFGNIYFWVQCAITLLLWRSRETPYVGLCLFVTRVIVAFFSTVMLFTAVISGMCASKYYSKTLNAKRSFFWESEDGGYMFHVISTGAEWLLALSFLVFFLTFHSDFSRIQLDCGVKLKSHHHTGVIHRHSIISTDDETTPLTV